MWEFRQKASNTRIPCLSDLKEVEAETGLGLSLGLGLGLGAKHEARERDSVSEENPKLESEEMEVELKKRASWSRMSTSAGRDFLSDFAAKDLVSVGVDLELAVVCLIVVCV